MNDREKFLFDLQGFLVVRNFLSPEEVQALNEAIDANEDKRTEDENSHPVGNLFGDRKRGFFGGMLTWEKPWCQPYRDLLAHPKIVPYLNTALGRGWKLDHSPFILCGGKGSEGLRLHGATSIHFMGVEFYTYANGVMRCGMIACQYQLRDVNPGDGGFCVMPGSHKANYPCPQEILHYEADQEIVYHPTCKAGDLIIFNEATIHGTLPWTAQHERRSLLYRYSPKYLHFAGGYYKPELPEWVEELTETQQAVLEPPYVYHRPLIEDDGETLVRPRRERP